ncbi:MAG: hypothetical protein L3J04_05030 [Robiginitomaculum sp.]|nr:hypothetical protein [Robiginitomaculum sp.]
MNKQLATTVISVVLFASTGVIAVDNEYRWSTGIDFTSGNYSDTQKTEILYVPFSGTALFGNFTAKATVPFIRITGPGTVVGGGDIGPIRRNRLANAITTQSGLGDITASLSYTKILQDNTLFVDFTGKVKLPTASSQNNLGTGQTDYTTQMDFTKISGSVNWFGTIGYRFIGSSSVLPLQSGFLGSAGMSVNLSDNTSIGMIYDYREAAGFGGADPSEMTGFVSYKLSKQVRFQTYAILGFSNGSPDAGGGISLSFRH